MHIKIPIESKNTYFQFVNLCEDKKQEPEELLLNLMHSYVSDREMEE